MSVTPTASLWLVIRTDFDAMENQIESARVQRILGYEATEALASAFVAHEEFRQAGKFTIGWDRQRYPQWSVLQIFPTEARIPARLEWAKDVPTLLSAVRTVIT